MQQVTMIQKLLSLVSIIAGIVSSFFLFDRGWLVMLSLVAFIFGVFLSSVIIKREHSLLAAIVPVVLWILAITISRISTSYKYYSNFDFIDPIRGFLLSVLIGFAGFCITAYYLLKRSSSNSEH